MYISGIVKGESTISIIINYNNVMLWYNVMFIETELFQGVIGHGEVISEEDPITQM